MTEAGQPRLERDAAAKTDSVQFDDREHRAEELFLTSLLHDLMSER